MTTFRTQLWTKIGLAALLVGLGDRVVYGGWSGAISVLLSISAVGVVAAAHPAAARQGLGRWALGTAAAFVLLPVERPSLLGWLFLLTALAIAALSTRARSGDDGLTWARRLAAAAISAVAAPVQDFRLASKARRRAAGGKTVTLHNVAGLIGLPLAGSAVFALLFAIANPVIARILNELRLPSPDVVRMVLWSALALGVWMLLRPRGLPKALRWRRPRLAVTSRRAVAAGSVVLSLVVFNALFALQNALDLAYLWGGVELPDGMTFAEYAHRGAYPLILTALLAGAFVLLFLAPGSEVARLKPARVLVTVWVGQNMFLVFSTALRTLDYVEAYSLTRLRIAALAWMALVAFGLGLVGWRLLRARSSSWLINANAAAAAFVLAICATVDLGAVAAAWNVRHARELGTGGSALDLCYLHRLGPAALVPLSELQRQTLPPTLQTRVADVRGGIMHDLIEQQQDWRRWTWRGMRRLERAHALAGPPAGLTGGRCDGTPSFPSSTPVPGSGS